MARRATIGGDEKPAGGEDAANELARRGRFFRGVPMALRATKVNEDRAGMGRFSLPLRVFFNRAVACATLTNSTCTRCSKLYTTGP